jgi:hypothetical protein
MRKLIYFLLVAIGCTGCASNEIAAPPSYGVNVFPIGYSTGPVMASSTSTNIAFLSSCSRVPPVGSSINACAPKCSKDNRVICWDCNNACQYKTVGVYDDSSGYNGLLSVRTPVLDFDGVARNNIINSGKIKNGSMKFIGIFNDNGRPSAGKILLDNGDYYFGGVCNEKPCGRVLHYSAAKKQQIIETCTDIGCTALVVQSRKSSQSCGISPEFNLVLNALDAAGYITLLLGPEIKFGQLILQIGKKFSKDAVSDKLLDVALEGMC